MRDVGTLLEALPYIRDFHGRTVVIKYGGAAMTDDELKEDFARDVVLLKYVGMNPVVVHGGGPDITRYMERLGMEVRFVEGLRVSDEATVEVAKMVLVGKQNKDIVLLLGRHGQPAVGLSGDDGLLFTVKKRLAGETDVGFIGDIERVDVDVLNHIAEDYIPVVASVGADAEGRSYNVNADAAAGAVAEALGAHKVVFLTDVEGNEHLDFLTGISVLLLGHSHPAVVDAITEQAGRLMHVSNLFYSEPSMRLAQRLSERSLGGKAFFCNSGAEAAECAIKLARRHKPRGEIVGV